MSPGYATSEVVSTLHDTHAVRSLVLLTVVAVAVGYGVVRTLPESEAEAETTPGKPGEVGSIALDGRGLPTAALRSVLTTHAGDPLDDTKLDRDRAALAAALVARGYLDAQVQAAHVVYDSYGAAFVTFSIAAGPRFRVGEVTVTGAADHEAGMVTMVKGEPVTKERIEYARAALSDRLAARGKHVTVEVKLAADQAAHTVDVELVVH